MQRTRHTRSWVARSRSAVRTLLHEQRKTVAGKLNGVADGSSSAVPKPDAEVHKAWYTREDKSGRTVLMQVEEGIANVMVRWRVN